MGFHHLDIDPELINRGIDQAAESVSAQPQEVLVAKRIIGTCLEASENPDDPETLYRAARWASSKVLESDPGTPDYPSRTANDMRRLRYLITAGLSVLLAQIAAKQQRISTEEISHAVEIGLAAWGAFMFYWSRPNAGDP